MTAQQMLYATLVSIHLLGTCWKKILGVWLFASGCFSMFSSKRVSFTCRIMIAAISFLLGYENVEQADDSDASSGEDEANQDPHVILSKEDVYKVILDVSALCLC